MDLSVIKDILSDYSTFGRNIGTALQSIPSLIVDVFDFFNNFGDLADASDAGSSTLSSGSSDKE